MQTRPWLGAAAVLVAFGAALLAIGPACTSEADVTFGKPANLSKENLPGEAGAELLVCGGEGGSAGDGGPCSVSWKTDIYPRMVGPDGWQCATSTCHAPANKQAPAIDPMDPTMAHTALLAYKMTRSKQTLNYIDTSGDPSKSSIECNLGGGCNPTMPSGNGKPLTLAERCQLHAWLLCGAPDN